MNTVANLKKRQSLIDQCGGLDAKMNVNRQLSLTEMIMSPTLGESLVAMKNSGKEERGNGTAWGLDPLDSVRMDELEHLRLDLIPTLELFSGLVRAAEQSGAPMIKTKKQIQEVRELAKDFVTKTIKMKTDYFSGKVF